MSGAPAPAPSAGGVPDVLGTCHGFEVSSELPLDFLRQPTDVGFEEKLHVQRGPVLREPSDRPLLSWEATTENPFSARLHELEVGFGLWIDGLGAYVVDPGSGTVRVCGDVAPRVAEPRLWGIPSALCFIHQGDVSLHAAAVEVDGRAILLTGPGRFGKTTLAAAFDRAGHRILSEDLCRCRPGDVPVVFPAPAMLRMRPATLEALGAPRHSRVISRSDERVHFALDGAARGGGAPVPIAAIVTLHLSEGSVELEPRSRPAAIHDLWSMSFRLPTDDGRERCFQGISHLADRLPTWRLSRRLSFESLPGIVDRIITTCVDA